MLDTVGYVYLRKQLPQLAVPLFERCAEKDPKNPEYHYHLGLAYAQTGDSAKARRSLEEALRLNPSFPGAADAQKTLATLKSGA